jgi:large subunit ribosomal protein L28
MANACEICGKKTIRGNSIARRGKAKKQGGVGIKTTGITRRLFKVNLQRIRILQDGKEVRAFVCTGCIKAGKVRKA